jgi:hypothetical protein
MSGVAAYAPLGRLFPKTASGIKIAGKTWWIWLKEHAGTIEDTNELLAQRKAAILTQSIVP